MKDFNLKEETHANHEIQLFCATFDEVYNKCCDKYEKDKKNVEIKENKIKKCQQPLDHSLRVQFSLDLSNLQKELVQLKL